MKRFLSLALLCCLLCGCTAVNRPSTAPEKENPSSETTKPSAAQPQPKPVAPAEKPAETPAEKPQIAYEDYSGEVPHIFIHCLIAYPEIRRPDGRMPYDNECITVTEFNRMLEELWKNGYSLVDLYDTYARGEDGKLRFAPSISVPKGRKPFVLSVDDVVYDYRKRGHGMVDGLILDENKNILSVTYQKDGSAKTSAENEWIPLLESFIAGHPEFSSHDARATLCMTGFAGVFGYRTEEGYEGDRQGEIQKATALADRLKELGYSFASHSYGHRDVNKHTEASFRRDLEKMKNEVVPIVGPLRAFVYPYGKLVYPSDARYRAAQEYGFELFCSVSHFFFRREYETGDSLYMTRVAIDGYSLRNYKTVLAPLMDVDTVIDKTR